MNLKSFPCAIEPCSTTNSQPSLDIRGTYTQAVACGSWVSRCYGEHRRKRDGARSATFHYTNSGVRCTPSGPSRQQAKRSGSTKVPGNANQRKENTAFQRTSDISFGFCGAARRRATLDHSPPQVSRSLALDTITQTAKVKIKETGSAS